MKKHLLLTFTMLLSTFGFITAQEYVVDDLKYTVTSVEKHEVSVQVRDRGISGDIVIPTMVKIDDIEYKVTSIDRYGFRDCKKLKSVIIPESVTSIGEFAFGECPNVTSITIPEGIISINSFTFQYCTSLTSINIPQGVISIGASAFRGCESLTSITIPERVTSIGAHAFANCGSLVSITIPESVISIGKCAFAGCDKMEEIIVDTNNINYLSYNKALYNKDMTVLIQVPAVNASTSYIIPESVTEIGDCAFICCRTLTSITIPQGVTSIGEDAFGSCSSLISITIPKGVISIGSFAFVDCENLTSTTIPEGVTSIGMYAFRNCTSLKSIIIPESITTINEGTFSGCNSLESISISEGVSSIGWVAFSYCTMLTTLTLPESVTSIEDSAFSGCWNLSTLYSLNSNAPKAYPNSFEDCKRNAILYVPKGSKEAYASADGWSFFSDIREISDKVYSLALNVVCDDTPIEGDKVNVLDSVYYTDDNGRVEITGIEGLDDLSLKFTVDKAGYTTFEGEADFSVNKDVIVEVNLYAAEAILTIKVCNEDYPIEGAIVTFEAKDYISDEFGTVKISGINGPDVADKILPITVYKDGYEVFEGHVDFTDTLDIFVVVTLVDTQNAINETLIDIENTDIKLYDLNGRRVIKPRNGQIYLINGHKEILKL